MLAGPVYSRTRSLVGSTSAIPRDHCLAARALSWFGARNNGSANDFVYPRFTRIERIPAAGNRSNVTKKIVGDYPKIRQKILLTDDTKKRGLSTKLAGSKQWRKVMRSPFYMPLTKLVKVYLPNK